MIDSATDVGTEPEQQPSGLVGNVNAGRLAEETEARKTEAGRLQNFLEAERPEPIPSFRGTIEDPASGRSGICCSGGGVRSAAFNLGALQALQESGELGSADYLAAVSGGSYIAAAFAMVAKCGPEDSDPDLIARQEPFAHGSPEEQYLRNHSAYLAPTGMDKLYLASRIVLGVAFNFAFIATPLFAIALILGAVVYSPVFSHLTGRCGSACSAAPPVYMWVAPVAVLGLSVAFGLAVLLAHFIRDAPTRFLQVWSTRLLLLSAAVAWVAVALPAVVAALSSTGSAPARSGSSPVIGGAGLAAVLAGVATQLRDLVASPSKALQEGNRLRQWYAKAGALTRKVVTYLVAAVVGPALLLGVMVFAASVALVHSRHPAINGWLVVIGLISLSAFAVVYRFVDLTTWSLHPFYKRRLCTAFALKRVKSSTAHPSQDDYSLYALPENEKHGVAVERDYDTVVELSNTDPGSPNGPLAAGDVAAPLRTWPKLLVCAAANVSDPGATPPGRQVTSFTFSAEEIGGPLVGGIATSEFEEVVGTSRKKLLRNCTLPAAVAMSGAALSPSMGKATRPTLRFLLALGNIRLGVWLPNPRVVARQREARQRDRLSFHYRRPRASYLIRELLGRNRIDAKYLYVTDGGHYENLGLVELLRRGCTRIYCFDASGGQDFKELGDAVALARTELDVEIQIDPTPLSPTGPDNIAEACAVKGSFTYSDSGRTSGTLIYARNVMTNVAPWDVKAFHRLDPSFPHDPTTDQLYTDQRFEAYRALGFGAGGHAVTLMPPDLLELPQPGRDQRGSDPGQVRQHRGAQPVGSNRRAPPGRPNPFTLRWWTERRRAVPATALAVALVVLLARGRHTRT